MSRKSIWSRTSRKKCDCQQMLPVIAYPRSRSRAGDSHDAGERLTLRMSFLSAKMNSGEWTSSLEASDSTPAAPFSSAYSGLLVAILPLFTSFLEGREREREREEKGIRGKRLNAERGFRAENKKGKGQASRRCSVRLSPVAWSPAEPSDRKLRKKNCPI